MHQEEQFSSLHSQNKNQKFQGIENKLHLEIEYSFKNNKNGNEFKSLLSPNPSNYTNS
jgi:hypothetical protein